MKKTPRSGLTWPLTLLAGIVLLGALTIALIVRSPRPVPDASPSPTNSPTPTHKLESLSPIGGHVHWIETFQDLPSMAKAVDLIVIGTVKDTRGGRVVVSTAGDKVPFTNIIISVENIFTQDGLKTPDAAMQEIVLEQTGGHD